MIFVKKSVFFKYHFSLFTIRKRSWGKVLFTQACVKNSVHRGGVYPSMPWGRQTPRQTPLLGQTLPLKTATAVDGVHPTGMHSCYKYDFDICKKKK